MRTPNIDVQLLDAHQQARLRDGDRTCKTCGETKHVSLFSPHLCWQRGKAYVVFRRECKACRADRARLVPGIISTPARRHKRSLEVAARIDRLVAIGHSQRNIARLTKLSRNTIRRHYAVELGIRRQTALAA